MWIMSKTHNWGHESLTKAIRKRAWEYGRELQAQPRSKGQSHVGGCTQRRWQQSHGSELGGQSGRRQQGGSRQYKECGVGVACTNTPCLGNKHTEDADSSIGCEGGSLSGEASGG